MFQQLAVTQQYNTDFDFDIHHGVVITKWIEQILCRKQIRAVVSIDQKLTLCVDETLWYCAQRVGWSFCHHKISRKSDMHLMQILYSSTRMAS